MGIMSKNCVRCGEKIREKSNGIHTCQQCLAELTADREERRFCPMDATEMEKKIISDIVVDKCQTCLGFWLDRGELGVMSNTVAKERAGDGDGFASGFILGMVPG